MGADCKSVGLRLRRFESCTRHSGQAPSRGGLIALRGHPVRSASAVDLRGGVECVCDGVQIVREQMPVAVEGQHRGERRDRRRYRPGRVGLGRPPIYRQNLQTRTHREIDWWRGHAEMYPARQAPTRPMRWPRTVLSRFYAGIPHCDKN